MLWNAFLLCWIDMTRLQLHDFMQKGEYSHFAKLTLVHSSSPGRHRHDFCEVFWIEAGEGHHRIGEQTQRLAPGDLKFICPEDEHDFRVDAGRALHLVNLAFSVATWSCLAKRYLPRAGDPFHLPLANREFHCTESQRIRLCDWSRGIAAGDRSRLATDRFLLNLLEIMGDSAALEPSEHPPEWLRRACEAIREPAHFLGGSHSFSRLSGRSAEHVARCARHFLGKTPTQIVNDARIVHA